jgi:hypothetical protein
MDVFHLVFRYTGSKVLPDGLSVLNGLLAHDIDINICIQVKSVLLFHFRLSFILLQVASF